MNKQESSYRWVVFGTALLAYYLIVSQRTAPGLITEQLMHDYHVSASVIGLMTSIQFFAYAGLQIPVGLLSDRYGPNRFLIIGTLLTGVGSVIFSVAPNEYVLLSSRLLVGIGDATIFVNLVLILSQWFKGNEFVKLMGMIGLVASLGSLSATVPLSLWISHIGWNTPFLSIGIILAFLSYGLYFVLVSKPKQLFRENSDANNGMTKKRESVWVILRRLVTTRQAWATFLCHFGAVGTYIGFIGSWGVPYGMNVFDLTRSQASQLIMYGLFGAMLGGPLISWMSGRLNMIKKIYTVTQLITFFSWVIMFCLGIQPSVGLIIVLLFLIGFGNGASSLTFAIVRKSFPIHEVGVASGFANMGGFLSAVVLPIVFGHVLDLFSKHSITSGYHYALLIPVVFSLMGFVGISLFKEAVEEIKEVKSA
ncbi:MFS transporter [Priestia megaterium]|nr:MFS transporter [Priestia megaterium]